MPEQQPSDTQNDTPRQPQPSDQELSIPKTESSSEFEGAADEEHTGNTEVEVKTESSSSSGQ